MRFPPKPHHKKTFKFAVKHPYSILSLDMGLGKTFLSLYIRQKLKIKKTLVICPSYLIPTWREEIIKHIGNDRGVSYFDKGDKLYYPFDSRIVVTSYDLGQKMESLYQWADMVIFDEAHSLSNMETKRTEFYHRVIYENSIKRVHFLTGTPIQNGVYEFYSLLALCNYNPSNKDPKFLKTYPDGIKFATHFSYKREYTIEVGNRRLRVLKFKGLRKSRLHEFKQYRDEVYTRINSEDVLTLEPLTHKNILVSEIPDPGLLEAFLSFYEGEGAGDINASTKAESALKKVPFTVKYAKNVIEEMGCVVIYTDHKESCKALATAFDVEPITGDIPVKKRHAIADKFKKGLTNVLVATIGSYSTGVDLTRSNSIILNDYPWTPGKIKQALYRILRLNQTRNCVVHMIFGSPQDKYIYSVVEEKQQTIEAVT